METQKKFEQRYSEKEIDCFLESPLGQMWQLLPFDSLGNSVKLPTPKSPAGRKGWLNTQQAIGLLFLKHYEGLSDAKLLRNLSCNYSYQLFCGILLEEGVGIKDMSLLSTWRSKLGHYMDTSMFQCILQYHWREYFEDKQVCKMDASCIESYISYPTSVKLLWRAAEWVYTTFKSLFKRLKMPFPRNRFKEQQHKQRSYQYLKKPTFKQRKKREKALIHHLSSLLSQLETIGEQHFKPSQQQRLRVIKEMLQQQKNYFDEPESKIENRIVSLHKPYVRPIIRGKENKRVEFGAKVHFYQVDNFDFIDVVSFEAFNETTRFQSTIRQHQENIAEVKFVAADRIYQTNSNRKFCSENKIQNNFIPKGPAQKDERNLKQTQKLKHVLSSDRSTRLEGAFGNVKNHYLANKNRARTQENEIIWIVFATHTANVSKIRKKVADTT